MCVFMRCNTVVTALPRANGQMFRKSERKLFQLLGRQISFKLPGSSTRSIDKFYRYTSEEKKKKKALIFNGFNRSATTADQSWDGNGYIQNCIYTTNRLKRKKIPIGRGKNTGKCKPKRRRRKMDSFV